MEQTQAFTSPRVGRSRRMNPKHLTLSYVEEISPDDEMMMSEERAGGDARHRYFGWGFAALDAISVALAASQFDRPPKAILDFPCGHGRVMRMLAASYPEAALTACDINHDGIDFCARAFGATPAYSRDNADEIEIPGRFELIWVGSLFSHLDAPRWNSFLRMLVRHLEPGGVLVFTTLGRTIADEIRAGARQFQVPNLDELVARCDREGFAYEDYVGQSGYGIALVRPWWVCRELEQLPEIEIAAYTEGGWNGRQDAVACRVL
jgi:2-polyprenyl-3-methyl-5-hydroxy-6-metoxy-1,4-benzoquinol methylase